MLRPAVRERQELALCKDGGVISWAGEGEADARAGTRGKRGTAGEPGVLLPILTPLLGMGLQALLPHACAGQTGTWINNSHLDAEQWQRQWGGVTPCSLPCSVEPQDPLASTFGAL